VIGGIVALAIVAAALWAFTRGGEETAGRSGDPSTSPTTVTSPSPVQEAPLAPTGVKGDAAPFKVVITWDKADGQVSGYLVSRNGKPVGTVEASVRRFADPEVLPSSTYRYRVVARGPGGTSPSADVKVTTPEASLSLARLQGLFDVRLRLTSSFGLTTSGGQIPSAPLTFAPNCGQGACPVKVRSAPLALSPTTLAKSVATYSGSGTQRQSFTCNGTPLPATAALRIRVTAADAVKNDWRATKIEGTLSIRASSQLGCVAAGTDYDLTGKLFGR
jgi:hypothetical protein